MPAANTCVVCARPDLAEIDAALDAGEGLNATAPSCQYKPTSSAFTAWYARRRAASISAVTLHAPWQ
jgi:hypothetical protein